MARDVVRGARGRRPGHPSFGRQAAAAIPALDGRRRSQCLPRLPCLAVQVLRLVVRLYEGVAQPDYAAICQCLMTLDDADEVAAILARLLGWVPRQRSLVPLVCSRPCPAFTRAVVLSAWHAEGCQIARAA